MLKKESKENIKKLIDKYEKIKALGKLNQINEAQTRNEFIEPLFEFLGWDMRNLFNDGEVTTEENITGGRVDLTFRVAGIPKMYLEAKPLKADLDIKSYSKQAINYAWNKGVAWAILTDFESIKVYNSLTESKHLYDKLVFEIPYTDYLTDERILLLSKKAFQTNELDKYAEKYGKKIKKITVNEKLFKDLKECREILTKYIGIWNEEVDKETLDEGIQKILDRLVFIRVLEDRELEPPILLAMLHEWEKSNRKKTLFQLLVSKFRELDNIYNSNLFTKHACEDWEDHEGAIGKVIKKLYSKDTYDYNFNEIPADILGGVYESYLGHIEKSKESREESRTKRRSQGIYYTPNYIVNYIVENTLGKALRDINSISDLKQIKVLDPACGSGAFLTRSLEEINRKYKEFGNPGNQNTKNSILLENIYGVDLDSQAVEIASLNLLLEALNKKTRLPSLTKNIKVGNSLISKGRSELKPFDWNDEFKEVFDQGGFDVIIGNPPYIKEYTNKSAFDNLHDNPYYQGKMDIWTLFACQSIDLLKEDGYLSFIAPNNWLTNAGASILREKILKEGEITKFIDFGDYKIFKDAGIQTMIFIFQKCTPKKEYITNYSKNTNKNISENILTTCLQSENKGSDKSFKNYNVILNPEKLTGKNIVFTNQINDVVLKKIESKKNFELLREEVAQGIVGDPDKAFIFSNKESYNNSEKRLLFDYYTSVGKFSSGEKKNKIAYLNKEISSISKFPNINAQLKQFTKELENRREVKNGRIKWFQLHWPRNKRYFEKGPKIVSAIRTPYPKLYYTENSYYGSRAMNFIKSDRINLRFLTAILNSRISHFWLKNKGKQLGELLQIDKRPLLNIPLYKPTQKIQNRLAQLVDQITRLNQELQMTTNNTRKSEGLKQEIQKVDTRINKEVYKLYDLTEEEIKIVEWEKSA